MCLVTGPLSGELRSPPDWDPAPLLCHRPHPRPPWARTVALCAHPAGPSKGAPLQSNQSIRRIAGRQLGEKAQAPRVGEGRGHEVPSALRCPDVRRPKRACALARVVGKARRSEVSLWQPAGKCGRASGLRSDAAVPQLDPRAVPPSGARRVRGFGLHDSGRLAVTAALGWPFPAL